MKIEQGKLDHPAVLALLEAHHQDMLLHSPVGSVHALDISGLQADGVTFWTLWVGGNLAGCGAIKQLENGHGEIKSMRTSSDFLRQGIAAKLLTHIIEQARGRGYQRLSLETGTASAFAPAHQLYQQFGFSVCQPFGDYKIDPFSLFMSRKLP